MAGGRIPATNLCTNEMSKLVMAKREIKFLIIYIIGRTTSGNYSFNFKKNLTFGYIKNDYTNEELQSKDLFVEVEKKKYPIDLITKPLKQTDFKNN